LTRHAEHNPLGSDTRRERRDAAEHRQQILTAARQLFAAQGVAETTMQEIGRVAGVGQGTLYRRFADKGHLCSALLEDDFAAFQKRMEPILDGPDAPSSALTRLGRLLDEFVVLVDSHSSLLASMQELRHGGGRTHFLQKPFHVWLHTRIMALLTEASAQGEVRALDPAFLADAILSVIIPSLIGFQEQYRGFSRKRIAAGIRCLFIDGLRVPHQHNSAS
jgi:AcrR family transcriptional regulator